jgi:hypothetical protein
LCKLKPLWELKMAATEAIIAALERNWDMVDAALEGMDEATLARMPNPESNSAAWILWHWSRVLDTFVFTRFKGQEQLWVTEGWHQKFGMSDDQNDRGVGWTVQQVAAWKPPSRDVLLGYYQAARAAVRDYLTSISDADLEVVRVIPPVEQPRSVASAVGQMVWESVAHGGQIAYLRGLHKGAGWFV